MAANIDSTKEQVNAFMEKMHMSDGRIRESVITLPDAAANYWGKRSNPRLVQ